VSLPEATIEVTAKCIQVDAVPVLDDKDCVCGDAGVVALIQVYVKLVVSFVLLSFKLNTVSFDFFYNTVFSDDELVIYTHT